MEVAERLTGEEAHEPSLIGISHLHRYQFAAGLLGGKRVLDLCCGTGYGTEVLAGTAERVHGVDIDAASIERASRAYGETAGVSFEAADALDVLGRPLAEDFDAIVMFEGLEHVPEVDRAIDLLARQRESGVALIVSLPNSKAYEEDNPYHLSDFDFEGAADAFRRIGMQTLLYQYLAEGSLIRPRDDAPLSGSSQLAERGEPEHCNNVIGIAGLGDPDGLADARMHLTVAPASNTYMLELERANRRLWRENRRLARERLGVADSAAASALERLRQADEARRRYAVTGSTSAPRRAGAAIKRAVALILPHGLILRQQRRKDGRREGTTS
jgi:SAM-dependent methyltransferase